MMTHTTTAPIYLDFNATTPLDPAVIAAMRPYLEQQFGNPSSSHAYGGTALEGVEQARAQVAAMLGCAPDEIVFTGSGSESDNQAIKGIAFAHRERGQHIITNVNSDYAARSRETSRLMDGLAGCKQ